MSIVQETLTFLLGTQPTKSTLGIQRFVMTSYLKPNIHQSHILQSCPEAMLGPM